METKGISKIKSPASIPKHISLSPLSCHSFISHSLITLSAEKMYAKVCLSLCFLSYLCEIWRFRFKFTKKNKQTNNSNEWSLLPSCIFSKLCQHLCRAASNLQTPSDNVTKRPRKTTRSCVCKTVSETLASVRVKRRQTISICQHCWCTVYSVCCVTAFRSRNMPAIKKPGW